MVECCTSSWSLPIEWCKFANRIIMKSLDYALDFASPANNIIRPSFSNNDFILPNPSSNSPRHRLVHNNVNYSNSHINNSSIPPLTADSIQKVRILCLGDSGVGKSSFLHYFSSGGEILKDSSCTIGCVPYIYYHVHLGGKPYWIEFFDIGCNRKFEISRDIFYQQINGIALFFDSTNRKTYTNIRKWIKEIVAVDKVKPIEEKFTQNYNYPNNNNNNSDISGLPVLCIATKIDLCNENSGRSSNGNKTNGNKSPSAAHNPSTTPLPVFECMKDYGLESIVVSSIQPSADVSASKLHSFLDQVIERRFGLSHPTLQTNPAAETISSSSFSNSVYRRTNSPMIRVSHSPDYLHGNFTSPGSSMHGNLHGINTPSSRAREEPLTISLNQLSLLDNSDNTNNIYGRL
jgi:hypothetical protein